MAITNSILLPPSENEKRSCFQELRKSCISEKRSQLVRLNFRISQFKPISPPEPTIDDVAKLEREARYLVKTLRCFRIFKETALARVQTMEGNEKRSKQMKQVKAIALSKCHFHFDSLSFRFTFIAVALLAGRLG